MMTSRRMVAGTSNAAKLAGLRELLAPKRYRELTPHDVGFELDVDEVGNTFESNPVLSAEASAAISCEEKARTGRRARALTDALGYLRGVFARYTGP